MEQRSHSSSSQTQELSQRTEMRRKEHHISYQTQLSYSSFSSQSDSRKSQQTFLNLNFLIKVSKNIKIQSNKQLCQKRQRLVGKKEGRQRQIRQIKYKKVRPSMQTIGDQDLEAKKETILSVYQEILDSIQKMIRKDSRTLEELTQKIAEKKVLESGRLVFRDGVAGKLNATIQGYHLMFTKIKKKLEDFKQRVKSNKEEKIDSELKDQIQSVIKHLGYVSELKIYWKSQLEKICKKKYFSFLKEIYSQEIERIKSLRIWKLELLCAQTKKVCIQNEMPFRLQQERQIEEFLKNKDIEILQSSQNQLRRLISWISTIVSKQGQQSSILGCARKVINYYEQCEAREDRQLERIVEFFQTLIEGESTFRKGVENLEAVSKKYRMLEAFPEKLTIFGKVQAIETKMKDEILMSFSLISESLKTSGSSSRVTDSSNALKSYLNKKTQNTEETKRRCQKLEQTQFQSTAPPTLIRRDLRIGKVNLSSKEGSQSLTACYTVGRSQSIPVSKSQRDVQLYPGFFSQVGDEELFRDQEGSRLKGWNFQFEDEISKNNPGVMYESESQDDESDANDSFRNPNKSGKGQWRRLLKLVETNEVIVPSDFESLKRVQERTQLQSEWSPEDQVQRLSRDTELVTKEPNLSIEEQLAHCQFEDNEQLQREIYSIFQTTLLNPLSTTDASFPLFEKALVAKNIIENLPSNVFRYLSEADERIRYFEAKKQDLQLWTQYQESLISENTADMIRQNRLMSMTANTSRWLSQSPAFMQKVFDFQEKMRQENHPSFVNYEQEYRKFIPGLQKSALQSAVDQNVDTMLRQYVIARAQDK